MIKTIYTLLLFIPLFSISCSDDDKETEPTNNNPLEVTYKVTSSPSDKTYMQVSYNDSQGYFIVKIVDSGWTYDTKLPKGKKQCFTP